MKFIRSLLRAIGATGRATVALVGICPFTDAPMLLNFNEIIINSDSFLLAITLSLLVMEAGARLQQSVRRQGLVLNLRDKVALAIGFPAILTWSAS